MQTFRLNGILHEVRLGDNGRDGQAHRDGHAAQSLGILREALVAAAHVAGVEVRVRAHGREVQRVDARLGEHQDADTRRLLPDAIEVVPGWIAGGAVREEGLQHVPCFVHLRHGVAVYPVFEAIRLGHIDDRFRASEKERAADVGGNGAHQLPAETRDLVVIEGREATEEHGAEGEVHDELVDNAGDEQGAGFTGGHELHGCAGVSGEGEGVT